MLNNIKCKVIKCILVDFNYHVDFDVGRYEWHHPIVLIGHSFGGLVLKSFVVKLKRISTFQNRADSWSTATVQCAKAFMGNLRGVAFYAVPHAGASNIAEYVNKLLRCCNQNSDSWWQATLECAKVFLRNVSGVAFYFGSRNFAEYVSKLLRWNIRRHLGIMDNIQPWQRDMEELSVDFDEIANAKRINMYH